ADRRKAGEMDLIRGVGQFADIPPDGADRAVGVREPLGSDSPRGTAMKHLRLWLLVASLVAAGGAAGGEPPAAPPVMPLDAAVRYALETNPQLMAARTQR